MCKTIISTAIMTATETLRNNRGADKLDKKSGYIVRIKRDKSGVLVPAPMVKPERRVWSLSQSDYESLCKAVIGLYLSACAVNRCIDLNQRKKLYDWFVNDVQNLLHLCDSELNVYENARTVNFPEYVLSHARKVAVYDDGRHPENNSYTTFAKRVEDELAVILSGATFAPDYERDWNKAKYVIPNRIKRFEDKLAAAMTRMEAAEEAVRKESSKPTPSQSKLSSLNNVLSSEKDAVEALKKSLAKAQDSYKAAKAAYETAKTAAKTA